jgi:hypothetical protein
MPTLPSEKHTHLERDNKHKNNPAGTSIENACQDNIHPLLLILLLPCYFCCSSPNGELSPAQGLHQDNTIVVDGIECVYDYYVPGDLGAASIPIVLLLHGGGSSKDDLTGESGFKAPYRGWMDLAESEKFLVIYPEATVGPTEKRNCNDCRADATSSPDVDAVGFIDALIDHFANKFNIDASLIYASGTSNEGHMSLRPKGIPIHKGLRERRFCFTRSLAGDMWNQVFRNGMPPSPSWFWANRIMISRWWKRYGISLGINSCDSAGIIEFNHARLQSV